MNIEKLDNSLVEPFKEPPEEGWRTLEKTPGQILDEIQEVFSRMHEDLQKGLSKIWEGEAFGLHSGQEEALYQEVQSTLEEMKRHCKS